MNVRESGRLVGAEERPGLVGLYAAHEEVGDPEGVEEVPRTLLFRPGIQLQAQKVLHVGVPRLQIHREGAVALATTLVNVARRIIEDAEHGYEAVARAVRAANERAAGANIVQVEADSAGVLANRCAVAERLVDAGDAVVGDGQKIAGGQLCSRRPRVEESRRGMGDALRGEEIVGLEGHCEIVTPDAERHAHPHMLGPLHDFHGGIAEKVGFL